MRFLIDSMLPPRTVELLEEAGHEATTPVLLGAHNLPDDELIRIAASETWVIVTENARDFAHVTICSVLFVRKAWWASDRLTENLAAALDRWARAHPRPGPWPHWLEADLR